MPVIAFAVLGVTLLMPGAQWTPDSEMMQSAIVSMPEGIGVWGIIAITTVSGLISGITINAVFAFGEEIAWRGFLMKEFKGKKFLLAALWIGIIWGLWHTPIIGISAAVVTPANDLLYGGAGLAGFIVLLMMDVCLYLYDRYFSKERVFASVL